MERMAVRTALCTVACLPLAYAETTLFPASDVEWKARAGPAVDEAAGGELVVKTDGSYAWPGVVLSPLGSTGWDLSRAGVLEVVVSNCGARAEMVSADAFPEGAKRDDVPLRGAMVPPGGVRMISVQLADARTVTDRPITLNGGLWGVIGSVGKTPLDYRDAVVEVFQCLGNDMHSSRFAVLSVRTAFSAVRPNVVSAEGFFPFVDRYGQFRHAEWPGKIHSDTELAAACAEEGEWLNAHPDSPIPDADAWGGWAGGPRLAATGFFRTEKVDGRWWLVDPEGCLFWSLGICSVYPSSSTVLTGRENYFEWAPEKEGASPGSEGVNARWTDTAKEREMIDFVIANARRKYGPGWERLFAEVTHRRFRAWGVNTIGNWSRARIRFMRRTPYCACIDFSSATRLAITKPKGIGRALPDIGSGQFLADLRERLAALAVNIKDDPWCLGVFVDNELAFGSSDDPGAYAEAYFSTVAREVHAALPNHLYLGCRIARATEDVWRAAARHCDVVSYNFYERLPTAVNLPSDVVDKPFLVGEFHFGALDRGGFCGGCAVTFDQDERAWCFRDYANACLNDSRIVGCHWFQYQDQMITGRFDGENLQCGFTSICDIPYPELVEACRETAAKMYKRRAGQ